MLVSILFSGFAQHHPYFVRTTEMNGLSDNRVTCFYKDKIGYMWIGTESGLNRYNGNEFKIYKPNIGSSTLSNGFVTAVREDNKGNMWITTRNGLNRIDFASDTSEIVTASSTGEKLLADLLWDVFPEDDTTIWIVKDARPLIRYNPVSGQVWQYNFQKFVVEKNIFPARKYKSILKIANKSTNEMWLATTHGIFLFNKNDSSFKPVLLRELDKISFFEFDADRQRLYCADESPYFHTYDLRTGRTKSIYTGERLHGNASSFPAWALPPKAFFIPTPSGPALIGERDSLLAQIRSLPISSLYRDRDQVTWLATDSGFIRFIPDLNKNIHITFPKTLVFDPEFALNSFLFDEKANQWILTACWENKLLRINNSNGTVTELKRPLKYANDTVYAFYQKGLDSIFMLCRGAILLYNVKNETWKKFSFPPPFKQWHITCMTIDGSGKFWIGTRRLGLFTYNPATGVVWSPDSEKFSPHIIHSLQYRQNTNSIWIATHTHGAFEYNLKNEKFYKVRGNDDNPLALHSSLINDICIDLKGNIWLATVDEGLVRLTTGNTNGYKVINYQIRHGLPGENVRSIASDQSNNLYFTSSGGIGWIDENGNLK